MCGHSQKKNQAVYRGITILYNHVALSSMDLNLIKLITIHACTGHVRDLHYNMTQVVAHNPYSPSKLHPIQ